MKGPIASEPQRFPRLDDLEGDCFYPKAKEHPKVQHRLAEIHLAKIGKLDRGEQLVEELTALQTDDQAA